MFFIDSIIRVINFIRFYSIFILNDYFCKSIIVHVIFFITKNNLREIDVWKNYKFKKYYEMKYVKLYISTNFLPNKFINIVSHFALKWSITGLQWHTDIDDLLVYYSSTLYNHRIITVWNSGSCISACISQCVFINYQLKFIYNDRDRLLYHKSQMLITWPILCIHAYCV